MLNDYIGIFIHQTDLHITNYVKSKLAPFNLAPEQNLVMMILWEQDGLTQNDVAIKLAKDKTNIARMSHVLEQKGFIRRTNCPKDKRSQRLYLTEEGMKLKDSVICIAEEFNNIVCNGITAKELSEVRKILSKMRENVQI
ncbi:MarR family transcriptional regulator [Cytobacillus sp. S13-E01]|uniref:MarR family winged helix-turn-helix transcriptional regulator n=1 Tax=Cytobacillus sp. S13-E01 TaxID=3031326 RepID=UPI0023D832C7|nr:MarR family transcriptional regulator [Cytobacillus sp. S13-E01]MDF0728125.1 MarR family transcriptional regulator [Cytobacillus sp. S13-E01]